MHDSSQSTGKLSGGRAIGRGVDRVCSACIDDPDVKAWIRDENGPRGCDACGGYDSPTVELKELCEYLEECLSNFWGLAADQLPYESAEGGYQGTTWLTSELVFEEVGLELPRDRNDRLYYAICRRLDAQLWCDYDWLRLDEDVALRMSWETFCETIKHKRRFFFHHQGGSGDDPDSFSHVELLRAISRLCDELGLINELSASTGLYRARTGIPRGASLDASTFGPPPAHLALQTNRMNPPGIPMFYGAEGARTAVREVHRRAAKVGKFRLNRPLRVLDLARLPDVPSIWANPDRRGRLGLRFLHEFTGAIMQPVNRDDRAHVDYIPSQVVTEFFRDFGFAGGKIDGIRFPSTADPRGRNVVLFLESVVPSASATDSGLAPPPLDFMGWRHVGV